MRALSSAVYFIKSNNNIMLSISKLFTQNRERETETERERETDRQRERERERIIVILFWLVFPCNCGLSGVKNCR